MYGTWPQFYGSFVLKVRPLGSGLKEDAGFKLQGWKSVFGVQVSEFSSVLITSKVDDTFQNPKGPNPSTRYLPEIIASIPKLETLRSLCTLDPQGKAQRSGAKIKEGFVRD